MLFNSIPPFAKAVPAKYLQQAAACAAICAIPVIAFAMSPSASSAAAPEASVQAVTAPVEAVVEQAVATPDSCGEQHWPYYSNACLRGASMTSAPRQISMAVAQQPETVVAQKPVKSSRKGASR